MTENRKKLPIILKWLLFTFLSDKEEQSAIGDFEEEYRLTVSEKGGLKAFRWYLVQILISVFPFFISRLRRKIMMLKNYAKVAVRNLVRLKVYSFINILGLSVSIGCCIVFFLLLEKEYSSDRFHDNAERIFLVGYTLQGDDNGQRWGNSPLPVGPALESDFPQVEQAVRIIDKNGVMQYQDKVFTESVRFVDPDFLEMFSFPLKYGSKEALSDRNTVIIDQSISGKYFGEENPVGKDIVITFDGEYSEAFRIAGVADKFPMNASFGFDILASSEKYFSLFGENPDNWERLIRATFIQLGRSADILDISDQYQDYLERHNSVRIDRPIKTLIFEPLPTLSWESQNIRSSISSGSTPEALIILFIIGFLLLLVACFNYVNIAIAAGGRRLKEIGIRKVIGGFRTQLVYQFLGENFILCIIGLISGSVLAFYVFLPGLFSIMGTGEEFSLIEFFSNANLWGFLILLLVITGIGAGAYPAIFISKFQPVNILSGNLKIKGKKRISGVLLGIQFSISFLILCLVTAFWQNNKYQLGLDWGYDQEYLLTIPLDRSDNIEAFKNSVLQNPNVVSSAGSIDQVGFSVKRAVVEINAVKHEVVSFSVGYNYLETMGIRLDRGRFFDPDFRSDLEETVIVNRTFVEKMNWTDPINKKINFNNRPYSIAGVVEDFHYINFFEEIQPLVFFAVPDENSKYLTLRINPGTGTQTINELKQVWQEFFPDRPYDARYQDSVFENAHRNSLVMTRIFMVTAIMTLIISCMGLFGLVALLISRRAKELSIRKVLGASVRRISVLITRRFIIQLSAAIILTIPFGWGLIKNLLDNIYKYHIDLSIFPFVLSALIVLFTAVLTIGIHVYKASVKNPVTSLRNE
ncbi:MAG: FtsX-like permease family protein [bacterium]|nr:FtsX-like permease family protein [bacterium]